MWKMSSSQRDPESTHELLHPDILDTIRQQVICDDDEKITKAYRNNSENIADTVLELLNIPKRQSQPKKQDKFEEMRYILECKDRVYNARKDARLSGWGLGN